MQWGIPRGYTSISNRIRSAENKIEVLNNVKDKKRLWKLLNSKSYNGKAIYYTTNTVNVIGDL